ncbi:hypothetical protein J7I93_22005 [Bacillus sp. ISL-47]|uniref:hypothetical protein n=1 Tax=Bacillus sp. ISL-47 TaxID=2819130 RepID=UPI001BE66998|nr:hypothetical protein [Bacillus sp. ISL-47]MBT2690818.1 hypothetical protein [Bacillus sp. ISL-47]MBT2709529.1 hypothetical protein [Pseudomonas sp. ISL-84]
MSKGEPTAACPLALRRPPDRQRFAERLERKSTGKFNKAIFKEVGGNVEGHG